MNTKKRSIKDIKRERDDLSTFLVHLTRKTDDGESAIENLINILDRHIIEARNPKGLCWDWPDYLDFTRSVCFTETPLNYVRYLFDIEGRGINLEPYGLVFSKTFLLEKGANPVFYINTFDKKEPRTELRTVIARMINNHPNKEDMKEIVAYFDTYGKIAGSDKIRDFYWEREWRFKGNFTFDDKDIIIGLCPDGDLDFFSDRYKNIKFISPYMSMEEIIQLIAHK
jgi:hypothetical protein